MPSPFAQPLSSCVPDCEPAPGFEKLRTIVTGERKICQAFSGSASPLMRPTEIEGGSSTQVEVRYFRPVDSLCCRRGILALEFHNLVARLHACLTSLTPSQCSQRKAGGSSDPIRNGFARNSFRLRGATCTDGGAHPPEAALQVCHDPVPFSLPAAPRACPSPVHRGSYPHDSSRGIHQPTAVSGLH